MGGWHARPTVTSGALVMAKNDEIGTIQRALRDLGHVSDAATAKILKGLLERQQRLLECLSEVEEEVKALRKELRSARAS